MSQRKAMKKTLKRLRSEAMEKIKKYNKTVEGGEKNDFILYVDAIRALRALFTYNKSLEYAYSEYEEEWNKLEAIKLEKMKKAVETIPDKPTKKKDKMKNQIYT